MNIYTCISLWPNSSSSNTSKCKIPNVRVQQHNHQLVNYEHSNFLVPKQTWAKDFNNKYVSNFQTDFIAVERMYDMKDKEGHQKFSFGFLLSCGTGMCENFLGQLTNYHTIFCHLRWWLGRRLILLIIKFKIIAFFKEILFFPMLFA